MKRYQIHVTKRIVAELIVEADSEQLARAGVEKLDSSKLQWREDGPTRIEHIDEIDGDSGALDD